MFRIKQILPFIMLLVMMSWLPQAHAEVLKPFILGNTPTSFANLLMNPGSMDDMV